MIRGYCVAGDLEKAMALFHRMRHIHGIMPDASLFNAILDGCAWKNMTTLTEQVLADMEDVGVLPSNQTMAILLRLYGRSRDLGKALEVFEELPKRYGLEVNAHSYGSLVSVCLSNGRLDLATEAFERMQRTGCGANARTYEALVNGCLRHGDLDRAVRLVDDALGLGEVMQKENDSSARSPARARLEPQLVEDMLQLIGRRRQAQRLGAPLVARLRAANFPIADSIAEAVLRSAEADSTASSGAGRAAALPAATSTTSPIELRQAERQRWRNFTAA